MPTRTRHLLPLLVGSTLAVPSLSAAEVLPAPDLNGYITQHDIPIMGSEDTCRDGRTCLALPGCDQTLTPGDRWGTIDWSNRVICLAPGDYRGNGRLEIPNGPSPDQRRWVRLAGAIPAELSTWTHPRLRDEADRAIVSDVEVLGGNAVVFSLSVRPGPDQPDAVNLRRTDTHDHVLLSHLDIDMSEQDVGDTGSRGVNLEGPSSDVVMQSSVIGPCLPRFDRDTIQIQLSAFIRDVAIVNIETFDCTHGQIGGTNDGFDGAVRIIENSDLYLTEDNYTTCDRAAFQALGIPRGAVIPDHMFSPDGPCMCAESAWDLKHGRVTFLHNRIWGFRPAGANQCGGTGSVGNAIGMLNYADEVTIEGNWFLDDQGGIALAHMPNVGDEEDHWIDHITLRNNVVQFTGDLWFQAKPTTGSFQTANGIRDVIVEGNTVVADPGTQLIRVGDGQDMDVSCNVFMGGSGSNGVPASVSDNVYLPSADTTFGEPDATVFTDHAEAGVTGRRCVYRRLITGPEQVCLDNVAPIDTHALPLVCDVGGVGAGADVRSDSFPGAFSVGEDEPVVVERVTVNAPRLAQPPRIDGALDDLSDDDTIAVGSARARVAWDADGVYLGVAVIDASIEAETTDPEGELYRDDSIEWMLDPALDGGGSLPDGDFKTLVNAIGTLAVRGGGFSYLAESGAQVAVETEAGGYTIEVALPTSLVGVPEEGTRWGFELVHNDVTGGTRTSATWSNSDGDDVNNADGWGQVAFVGLWDGPYPDAGGDTGGSDTGTDDTGVGDTGVSDSGVDDTSDDDAALDDTEVSDGSVTDTGVEDTSSSADTDGALGDGAASSDGCGCASAPSRTHALGGLLVLAGLIVRRRRS